MAHQNDLIESYPSAHGSILSGIRRGTGIYAEWDALLERRRCHNANDQDGSDFEQWKQSRGIEAGSRQLEPFV
ncbi:hypothetical protein D3C86_714060 [compost metagenome]